MKKEFIWEKEFLGGIMFVIDEGISRENVLECDLPLSEGGILAEVTPQNILVFNLESNQQIGEIFCKESGEKERAREVKKIIKRFHGITVSITQKWSSSLWAEDTDIIIVMGDDTNSYAVHMACKANEYITQKKKMIFLHVINSRELCKKIRKILNMSNENMINKGLVMSYSFDNLKFRQKLMDKTKIK